MQIDTKEIFDLRDNKLVTVREHGDLYIINYTPLVQFDKLWNKTLLKCRGLIIDKTGKVVAKPFNKFFNLSEHQPKDIPNLPFDVFEKLDGSLGICYYHHDKWNIATRGSFVSEQAIKAQKLLDTKYQEHLGKLNTEHTYLFEIIYPENRIVVDYGQDEKLSLIGIINIETGEDLNIKDVDIWPNKAKVYSGVKDIYSLQEINNTKDEGFVVRYSSGFRVKVKFKEYLRLHKLLTQVSSTSIWECLKNGSDLNEILDRVPDEFNAWVQKTRDELLNQHSEILSTATKQYNENKDIFSTRKELALWAKTQAYPDVIFGLADNKSVDEIIWKKLKPKYTKAFYEA